MNNYYLYHRYGGNEIKHTTDSESGELVVSEKSKDKKKSNVTTRIFYLRKYVYKNTPRYGKDPKEKPMKGDIRAVFVAKIYHDTKKIGVGFASKVKSKPVTKPPFSAVRIYHREIIKKFIEDKSFFRKMAEGRAEAWINKEIIDNNLVPEDVAIQLGVFICKCINKYPDYSVPIWCNTYYIHD